MGRGKKAEQRAARNRQYQGRETNRERAAIRIGQHGNNWQNLPVQDFARRNGFDVNFAGFWDISENGMKVEGTHETTGNKFVMDSTRAYYRVHNAAGQYVDADGRAQSEAPYYGDANAFNAASHFRNQRPPETDGDGE